MEKLKLSNFSKFLICSIILASSFFITSLSLSTEAAWRSFCGVKVSQSLGCGSTGSANDRLANFSHKNMNYMRGVNPYTIRHEKAEFSPSVTRGSPVYGEFVIHDPYNNKSYTYANYKDRYLNDYSKITLSTNRNLGYSPKEEPSTILYIRNGESFSCIVPPFRCKWYEQVVQYTVSN